MSIPRKNTASFVDHQFRIGFLGSSTVGKSSILKQLVWKRFTTEYKPTLEVDLDFVAEYNGSTYVCLLIDTCGQDDFPAMRKLCISRSNAFLVVFSLDDLKSFQYAKRMVAEIKSNKNEFLNIILIGNKRDLHRNVFSDEIKEFTESINTGDIHCRYMEVSAKDYDDVINMFHSLLDMMIGKGAVRNEIQQNLNVQIEEHKNDQSEFDIAVSARSQSVSTIHRSPSLFSLNSFSSDEDIDKCNYVEGEEQLKKSYFRHKSRTTSVTQHRCNITRS